MSVIYLDSNASRPIDPAVAAAMRPFLEAAYGNPSNRHWAGIDARAALDRARWQVAGFLGCEPDEVVFTSGGSETNNLAIKGTWLALRGAGDHIVTTQVEHPAVLNSHRFLDTLGARITYLPVDGDGRIDPDAVRRAITRRTVLISVMHANSETSAIQPLEPISQIASAQGVRLHTGAAQSAGKIPTNVAHLSVDLLSLVGHELGRRAGAESVLLTAGLGAACELVADLAPTTRIQARRDRLWRALKQAFGEEVVLNGPVEGRLPDTLNVSFVGRRGTDVLARLDGLAASTGMACHDGRDEMSPVLAAMGAPEPVGLGAVRFSLGRPTINAGIDDFIRQLPNLQPRVSVPA